MAPFLKRPLPPRQRKNQIVKVRYAMTSKHFNWQDRWQVDRAVGTAKHETGLVVKLSDGAGVAINAAEVEGTLVPQHGSHNAPAMVARLTREGAQMLIDPYSRGWRGTESKQPT